MKLTRFALAAALVAGSTSGYAAVLTPIGDITSGTFAFASTPAAGAFTDTLSFTLTTASFLTGTLTSVVSGTQDVDFTSVSVTGAGGPFNFMQVAMDPFETWALGSTQLAAGTYTLNLMGTNSASIGSYAGTLGVTPVPEAGTLAMMLAGLGMVGFMARRRQA